MKYERALKLKSILSKRNLRTPNSSNNSSNEIKNTDSKYESFNKCDPTINK